MNDLSYGTSISIESSAVQDSDSWNGFSVTDADFVRLDTSLAAAHRLADGSLPANVFLCLAKGSSLIYARIDVGLFFSGPAPDIGTFEYDSTITSAGNVKDVFPAKFVLKQNYPNPFNPSTKMAFNLSTSAKVVLDVYDILGGNIKTLVNSNLAAASHSVYFNGNGLSSGIYLYKIMVLNNKGTIFSDVKNDTF